ncbi:hypothetical protein A2311_02060 [candidate division WOR-1 bacterium RIFOXYB2_FULL_48_7]|uniref:Dipeptidylpeptidase IV N-terminal domain-containing protein n=1 Tax=candidate division WOR-1 bacterium RIFOXYB2_FULL_48_7 TaxID=1802583 RepID=A0A1F4TW57_UNCSA|nr:MAG: hypothetical protein A2311_02060 [candidate division WOR-1 bacterium RIFOXYB2_FULL_48_7]
MKFSWLLTLPLLGLVTGPVLAFDPNRIIDLTPLPKQSNIYYSKAGKLWKNDQQTKQVIIKLTKYVYAFDVSPNQQFAAYAVKARLPATPEKDLPASDQFGNMVYLRDLGSGKDTVIKLEQPTIDKVINIRFIDDQRLLITFNNVNSNCLQLIDLLTKKTGIYKISREETLYGDLGILDVSPDGRLAIVSAMSWEGAQQFVVDLTTMKRLGRPVFSRFAGGLFLMKMIDDKHILAYEGQTLSTNPPKSDVKLLKYNYLTGEKQELGHYNDYPILCNGKMLPNKFLLLLPSRQPLFLGQSYFTLDRQSGQIIAYNDDFVLLARDAVNLWTTDSRFKLPAVIDSNINYLLVPVVR